MLRIALLLIVIFAPSAQAQDDLLWVPDDLMDPVDMADRGDYEEALAAAETQLDALRVDPGPDSFAAIRALEVWAKVMLKIGRTGEPEVLAAVEEALAAKVALLGELNVEVAYSYHDLATTQSTLGDAAKAMEAYEKSLAIQEQLDEPDRGLMANSYQGLAISLARSGRLPEATPYFEMSVEQLEIASPGSAALAGAYTNLGTLRKILGDIEGAREAVGKAIILMTELFGPDSPKLSTPYYTRGSISTILGDINAAEADYRRALAINEATDPDHPQNAAVHTGLGILALETGDWDEARERFETGIRILEDAYGEGHGDTAYHYTLLCKVLTVQGEYQAALDAGLRGVEIHTAQLGPADPITAQANGIAAAPELHIDPQSAAERVTTAHAILVEAYGEDHLWVAEAAFTGAKVMVAVHRLDEALDFATQAVEGFSSVTEDQLDVATCLVLRGQIQFELGDHGTSFEDALRAESIARSQFRAVVQTRSERAAARFASARTSGLDLALSNLEVMDASPEHAERVWDAVIRSRGLIMDEIVERRRSAMRSMSPDIAQLQEDVNEARAHLADLYVRGPEEVADFETRFEAALVAKEEAEIALARESVEFRTRDLELNTGFAEVRAALDGDQALLAYLRYERQETAATRNLHYAALVLEGGKARVIPIGSAESIDLAIANWRETMFDGGAPGGLAQPAIAANREAGETLRRLVWDPVGPEIRDSELLFVVPDAALHLVQLSALPDGENKFLIEDMPLLHHLSTEKQLTRPAATERGSGLLLVGNPDFDARAQMTIASLDQTSTGGPEVFRGGSPDCESFRSVEFRPLPETEGECQEIDALWADTSINEPSAFFESTQATEDAFKRNAPGQRIVHLATHGYFVDESCRAGDGFSDNPLLLSGLAMAGANLRSEAPEGTDDGVLTAEEVALLDLSGVEWAVLSACETGVGSVLDGEGVYGLRRAFEAAGAQTVIMSLWPVGDSATREWMTGTYENRFANGMATPRAVRASSLSALEHRRSTQQSTHPIWWSGFVATGNWR